MRRHGLPTVAPGEPRLASVDRLRGLVIVVMALDHVREMLSKSPPTLDFAETPPLLFFTRWITHICAPTFVFLAGTSAFLFGAKGRSKRDVSIFLATRGVWLVFVDLTLISFAWHFGVGAGTYPLLGVIWAIGVSMIALAGLLWLPREAVAAVGAAMVLGHDALTAVEPAPAQASFAWHVLHIQGMKTFLGIPVFVVYPLVPWIGVMALGYATGPVMLRPAALRTRWLPRAGAAATLGFLVLRWLGGYGEPDPWTARADVAATLVDFLDTTKYPPSLQYLLMTLGPAALLLAAFERLDGPGSRALETIGRVPFFFYVVHLYVIHALALGLGVFQGFAPSQIAVIFFEYPPGFGVGLGWAYVWWVAVVMALYPACAWFARLKARRRDWWLSYV